MQIDADLQDPPEMLEIFFEQWQQGYQVVYGIRKKRPEHGLLRAFRKFGYWVIDKISEHPIPRDVGDFRLIDRKVIQSLCQIRTANPYLRGMIAGLGFNQIGIAYDRDARMEGKQIQYFPFDSPRPNSSVQPLYCTVAGRLIRGWSHPGCKCSGALYYLLLKIIHPELPQGVASIHILVLFGIGLNSFLLGIIGEYLLRIYLVLRADPVAIVEKSLNIDGSELKL